MEQGIDYNLTFAPVIAWPSIRLFLTFFAINNWVTRQLDLVLAYPHAKITRPTFMRIPRGFRVVKHPTNQRHVLRIIYNLYGGKDSGRIYYLFMSKYLVSLEFVQSTINPCIFFYKNKVILLMYVDDFVIGGATDADIDEALDIMQDNADVKDKGDINDYVGVHVEILEDGSIEPLSHILSRQSWRTYESKKTLSHCQLHV